MDQWQSQAQALGCQQVSLDGLSIRHSREGDAVPGCFLALAPARLAHADGLVRSTAVTDIGLVQVNLKGQQQEAQAATDNTSVHNPARLLCIMHCLLNECMSAVES